jgi:hypothetical protein
MISHPTNSPPKHNDTFDKQGGDSTSNEYYHLTEEQIDILEHVTGKHNDLNDIQGGSSGEYYHLTSAEHTVVQNTSGVNTGDQESSDFDHNQLQNTHNLTTDIDHNSITNTHNLTTDIDHDQITNTHNLTSDIDHNSITNTHNLTSDIDHDQITNTHNLTTDIDHNLISNLQGGDATSDEYYHLTNDQLTIVESTSGINTGDQSASDFNHNDLSNIDGGAAGDRQHLTSAEKSQALSGGGSDFLVVQVFS